MTLLSPLRPLLCRHVYYWSERHRSDRCRHCGKTRTGDSLAIASGVPASVDAQVSAPTRTPEPSRFAGRPPVQAPREDTRASPQRAETAPKPVSERPRPSALVLKAEAKVRRENLLVLLERLAAGNSLSREDAIDAVLAVMEDAHAAEPILFGVEAADQFAKLSEARAGLSV